MLLTRLKLLNIRSFRAADIPFCDASGSHKAWTLLLGDNATGKTTVLRSLAIGLCDESSAAGLVRELKGSLVREGAKEGTIQVELRSGDLHWTIQTKLEPIKKTGDHVEQTVYRGNLQQLSASQRVRLDEFPWEKLFVAGYGSGRSAEGKEDYHEYRTIDAVYTLFRYDQPLQGPELAWRRMQSEAASRERTRATKEAARQRTDSELSGMLHEVLVLDPAEEVRLDSRGISFYRGRRGAPLATHGDGYKSTTTWVLDLLAWRMLFKGLPRPRRMPAIVLIDELEQHLHPRWQRHLVGRLRRQFPRVQFVGSTHSPLCAASAADLRQDECSLLGFQDLGKAKGTEIRPLELPRGMRADQILTSGAFGLDETRNPELGGKVNTYRHLFKLTRRTKQQEAKLAKLRKELEVEVPAAVELESERLVRDELCALVEEARRLSKLGGRK